MCKSYISATLILTAIAAFAAVPPPAEVERVLEGKIIQDNFMDEDVPMDVPLRYRNSLKEYEFFIREQGCTTNEFVEALMLAATNTLNNIPWIAQ